MRSPLAYIVSALAFAACGDRSLNVNYDLPAPSTDLAGADLEGVILDFEGAAVDLAGADLFGTSSVDLTTSADLTGADLTGAGLSDMMSMDLINSGDLTPNGIACGNATCQVGQKCCVTTTGMTTTTTCAPSCPDAAFAAACDGPEDCTGNPCCVMIKNGTPSATSCTAAPTACAPMFSFAGTQTRACHIDSDCTSGAPTTMLNQCCTVNSGGQMGHVCLNNTVAQFIGATCP